MALAKHVELVEKQEKQREKSEKEKVKDVKAKENEVNEMNEKEKVKENGNEKEKDEENQKKKDAFEVKELPAPKEGVPSASPREVVFSVETPREPQRATKKVNRKAFQAGTPLGGHDRLGWIGWTRSGLTNNDLWKLLKIVQTVGFDMCFQRQKTP